MPVSVTLLTLGLLSATAPVHAQSPVPNARYLVVEAAAPGQVRVLHQSLVSLPGIPASMPAAKAAWTLAHPRRDAGAWDVRLRDAAGQEVFHTVVEVPDWVHVPLGRGDAPAVVPAGPRVAVVRVPLVAAATLVVQPGQDGKSVDINLDAVPAALPVSPPPQADNRVNILVMGDGYTAAQESLFNSHVQSLQQEFFSVSPYRDYANFFRLESHFVASSQSGADHPGYRSSCSAGDMSCCGDPEMQQDPLRGTLVNTAFDASFCLYNIHRLLYVSEAKVMTAAAAVPGWDAIMVLVNDTTYGGAGGRVTVLSVDSRAAVIAHHEFGHVFTLLADEYDSPYPSYPGCSDLSGPACEVNVTDVTTRSAIKWLDWIAGTTPVPTPETYSYDSAVGLFEGARYRDTGLFRPKQSCAMSVSEAPFCEVCKEAFVLRLYQGGWGTPINGIELLEPGGDSPAPGEVAAAHGQAITLSVQALNPREDAPLELRWSVDGVEVPGEHAASFTWQPPSPRAVTVLLQARDATGLVGDNHVDILRTQRQWHLSYANQAPVLGAQAPQQGTEGAELRFILNASDPDGDALSFSSSALPAGAALDAAGTFSWVPGAGSAGSYTVPVSVSDGAASASGNVSITVAANHAPQLTVPAAQTVAENRLLSFTVEVSDLDGDPVTLSADPLPSGASFDAASGAFSWTPDFTQAGSCTVQFQASDGKVTASASVEITVENTNRPPTLAELAPRQVTVGDLVDITLEAADPDGDTLVASAEGLPAGAQFKPESLQFTWTPGEDQVGHHQVAFTVTDGALPQTASLQLDVAAKPGAGGSSSAKGCACTGAAVPSPWSAGLLVLLAAWKLRRRSA